MNVSSYQVVIFSNSTKKQTHITSNFSKFILYGLLLLAAIYWTVKGDFVDSWDAYLWLIAFVFIELNVFDWRQESLEEQNIASEAPI